MSNPTARLPWHLGGRVLMRLLSAPLAVFLLLALASCQVPVVQVVTTSPAPTGKGISVPITVQRSLDGSTLVLISVKINNSGPYPFAVDTGASVSLISRSLAVQLGLQRGGGSEQVSGVGGSQRVIPVDISNWSASQIRLPATTIASADSPSVDKSSGMVGLLGSDVLSRFGAVTIDYSRNTLTVYQQIALAPQPIPLVPTVLAASRRNAA